MCAALLASIWLGGGVARGLEIELDPPGEREFVRDLAGMIDEDDKEHDGES